MQILFVYPNLLLYFSRDHQIDETINLKMTHYARDL